MGDDEKRRGCEECNWKGWLHMGEPFEIQGCDTCDDGDSDDVSAVELHRKDCGCDWPETDHQHYVRRASFYVKQESAWDENLHELMVRFHRTASLRDRFTQNLPALVTLLGQALEEFHRRWDALVAKDTNREVYGSLTSLAITLVRILSFVQSGRWKPHWTWNHSDGFEDGEKWFTKEKS